MQIVLGTKNEGKLAEILQIMAGLPVTFLGPADIRDWPEVEESGRTYLENALLKAEALVALTDKPAMADDSGLEVDALDGRPGVLSARLAGPHATDEQNNVRMASLLFGVTPERRTARYRCVALLLMPDGTQFSEEGVCEGSIAVEPKGAGGFGYDPWFIPEGETRTMAELSPEEKNAISHRGKAFRRLRERLEEYLPAGAGERS